MESKVNCYMWRVFSLILFFIILSVLGCSGSSSVSTRLDASENLMESRPDSALAILESINVSDIKETDQQAYYALLKSMALDKNYIDKTTFEVIQPAIDYYLEKGTPDEKLKTFYYQGRIYQNRNDRDSALQCYIKGLDLADKCNDSLTIARTLVVKGGLYKDFYDYAEATECFMRAANIYRSKFLKRLEFDCLATALNGYNIIKNKEKADSIVGLLVGFHDLDNDQQQLFQSLLMTYTHQFGSEQEIKDVIINNRDSTNYDANSILNLSRAFYKIGENSKAIRQLEGIEKGNTQYDTLKYLSIKYPILESLGKYEEALAIYKDFSLRLEAMNSSKFEQKSRSIQERHQLELQAEKDAERTRKIIWGGIVCLIFLGMVAVMLFLLMRRNKIEKNLAVQKVLTTEAENGKLKAENDLALEKARSAELENENLKTENEKLELANKNLELERDKKTLEAENLAHRVKELEGESDGLKELLQSQNEMPDEVRQAIKTRIEMLNSYLASQISDHKEFEKAYDDWVEGLTADKEKFMDSNRLAFQASHPDFIRYFEDHGLTTSEINYVCLYAIGLRGKDVGNYMKMRSHVNISSAIRQKLGLDKHETNIGIYVRKKLQEL